MYMYSVHTCTHIHIHTFTVNTHSCIGTHHTLHTRMCMCGVYVACYGNIQHTFRGDETGRGGVIYSQTGS